MPRSVTFRRLLHGKGISFSLGLFVIGVMVCCYVQHPHILEQLDNKIYDALLPVQKRPQSSVLPVIIDIDELSIQKYGQWPWPRYLIADLLEKLTRYGTASIALDILLSEPDRSSPKLLQEGLKRDRNVDVAFAGLPEGLRDYDLLLASSLGKIPAVLGIFGRFNEPDAPQGPLPPPVGMILKKEANARSFGDMILKADTATLPLREFWQSSAVGFINMSPDIDGLIRRVPLVMLLQDKLYASLSLRALMLATGVRNIIGRVGPDGLSALSVGPFTIPVSPDGNLLVPYQGGRGSYQYISAAAVLSGSLPENSLRGKIAFVGSSAPGLVDLRSTPFDRIYPGVEVHATVLDAIVSNHYIRIPPWTPGAQVLAICLLGLVAGGVFTWAKPRVYIFVGLLLLGSVLYVSYFFFTKGYFISPQYVLLTVAAQALFLLPVRFWQEEYQKILLRKTFSRYVSPEIVKRLAKEQGELFAGEECDITIMFTDIRGFTGIAEKLGPQQVVALLNRYFTPMTALVRGNSGTLDKFIGDALMAFWNAPVSVPDHPVLAVKTALAMQDKLASLNQEIEQEFGVWLTMGIGLHTGSTYVGNMGSEDLLNYTIIGDSVNITSRLEGLCKVYGMSVVVSEDTMARCGENFAFLYLDRVALAGKDLPIAIYAAMPQESWKARAEEYTRYLEAQEHYQNARFMVAAELFDKLCTEHSTSSLYTLFAGRAHELALQPPADWDGVWKLFTK